MNTDWTENFSLKYRQKLIPIDVIVVISYRLITKCPDWCFCIVILPFMKEKKNILKVYHFSQISAERPSDLWEEFQHPKATTTAPTMLIVPTLCCVLWLEA